MTYDDTDTANVITRSAATAQALITDTYPRRLRVAIADYDSIYVDVTVKAAGEMIRRTIAAHLAIELCHDRRTSTLTLYVSGEEESEAQDF